MIEKSDGLVIKTIKYSESTLIAKIFTRNHGLLSFIIPGARSNKKSAIGHIIQPTHFLSLDYYYQRNKNLLHIKECKLSCIHYQLLVDFTKKSIAIFYLEVLSKCIHDDEVNVQLYDFIQYEYDKLETTLSDVDLALAPLHYLLGLALQLGFSPHLNSDGRYFHLLEGVFVHYPEGIHTIDAESSRYLRLLLEHKQVSMHFLQRKILLQHLMAYFSLHVPSFGNIHSVEILHEILTA